MKKLLAFAVLAFASLAASAQTVVTASNAVYNLEQVRAINYNTFSSSMELTMMRGEITTISGSNALALYTSVINQVGGSNGYAKYVRVANTYKYIRITSAVNVFCSGGKSVIGWANQGSEDVDTTCAFFNTIKAASIQ